MGFDEVTLRAKAKHWDGDAEIIMRGWVPEHPEAAMPTLACFPLESLYMRKKYLIYKKPLLFWWFLLYAVDHKPTSKKTEFTVKPGSFISFTWSQEEGRNVGCHLIHQAPDAIRCKTLSFYASTTKEKCCQLNSDMPLIVRCKSISEM